MALAQLKDDQAIGGARPAAEDIVSFVYVDEINYGSSFDLGVLWLRDRETVKGWQDWLQRYHAERNLRFHRHEDFRGDTRAAAEELHRSILAAILEGPDGVNEAARFQILTHKNEGEAWRALYNWIERTLKPTRDQPVHLLHDSYDFSRKEGGAAKFLEGKDPQVIIRRAVPKVQTTKTSPDRNAFLIGCSDYMLWENRFKKPKRRQKK